MNTTTAAWERIGLKEHNGINVPLFSIYGNNSCGIGEFTDLIPLIDWCKEVSFDVIQLLPINDTGLESSPYSAISAFALNPIHLGLSTLPKVSQFKTLKAMLPKMQALNNLKRCDYKSLQPLKTKFLKEYFEITGKETLKSEDFKQFKRANPWAESFALFKTLRILHNWKNFEDFPREQQKPTLLKYTELLITYETDVNYHIFVQYHCFNQMQSVKNIANSKGVFLMGDIPILINRDSADVWVERNLFDLNYSAGAPPDMYASEGQNWGFPTYNWSEMEKEDYEWWKLRLKVASTIYDIYRIDHIIGFFRIWSIPYGGHAKDGHYIPEDFNTAMSQGKKILTMMINASDMLAIGEDLGNVPDNVRYYMSELAIPGTKVVRWERMWNEDRRFIPPENYPKLSLTTISTHDSETLQGWWSEKQDEAKDYANYRGWKYQDLMTRDLQLEALKTSFHTASLFHINLLQEILNLVDGFTSSNLQDERINLPGTVSDSNWTYRFQKPLEEIINNQQLKNIVQKLLS
jgi:4-alpha-glucanotransferase